MGGVYVGGAAAVPAATVKQGSTFDEMLIFGDAGASNANYYNYISTANIVAKSGATTMYARTDYRFANLFSLQRNTGTSATYVAAGQWFTVFSTAGTKGKLVNVFPPQGNGACTIEIEVTIDGKSHTYIMNQYGNGMSCFLGDALVFDNYPSTMSHTTFSIQELQGIPGSYGDVGFQNGSNNLIYIQSPSQAIRMGARYLQWTTDMKIRVRLVEYWVGIVAAQSQNKSLASFILDR